VMKVEYKHINIKQLTVYLLHQTECMKIDRYCHVLVTRHGVWIGNWIHSTLINRN
jgi:hypothetical protein